MADIETIKLSGNIDYAKVPARLKKYREENPKSGVVSTPHWHDDGSLDFETSIIRDKSDETSMSSTAWAHYSQKEMQNPKAFEKLETISVGRALAKQGFLNNGEIATTEEMDEFIEYRKAQEQEARQDAIEKLQECKSLDDLKTAFVKLGEMMRDEEVVAAKDAMKEKLSENTK